MYGRPDGSSWRISQACPRAFGTGVVDEMIGRHALPITERASITLKAQDPGTLRPRWRGRVKAKLLGKVPHLHGIGIAPDPRICDKRTA